MRVQIDGCRGAIASKVRSTLVTIEMHRLTERCGIADLERGAGVHVAARGTETISATTASALSIIAQLASRIARAVSESCLADDRIVERP